MLGPQRPRTLKGLALVIALGMSAASAAGDVEGSIEEFISETMPASTVPGLAYAVVADGEVTAVGARGVADIGEDTAVTPDTPFVIGSISKSFTALGVMQLVEAGKVDLDTGISRYLHEFSGRPSGEITVRQLLSHTSGFSTVQGNASHVGTTSEGDELARRVEQLAGLAPAFEPDETWDYSNANYVILGRLIEVVSGQDYQSYVTAHILESVGMSHSFVSDGETHPSMAGAHRPWFGGRLASSSKATDRATAPQGGIVASVNDLARYLTVMMNGEDDVLSADGKAQIMRPASESSPGYGFGWNLDTSTGAVWHDGVSPGVETLAVALPAEKKAAIVLVNGGSGFGFGETAHLRVGITDLALGLDWDTGESGWSRKALFVTLAGLTIIYLLGMVKTWIDRAKVRSKPGSGAIGLIGLWLPLLATGVGAWVLLFLVPSLYGTTITSLVNFVPDFVLVLVVSAFTGVLLALFRLAVAYTARDRPARGTPLTGS